MYIGVRLFSVQCGLISVINVSGDNDLSGYRDQVYGLKPAMHRCY